ncbi:MAG: Gmad2 immunoglobulin-like domain-containing protein [Patescibacteria group bacterium]
MRKVLLQIGVIAAVLLVGVLAIVYLPNFVGGSLRSLLIPPSGSETPGEEVPVSYGEEGLTEEVCRTAGGNWDSCGSACRGASEGTVCIKVCVPYCECGGIAGFSCPEGFACDEYLPAGAADPIPSPREPDRDSAGDSRSEPRDGAGAMGVCKQQESGETPPEADAPLAQNIRVSAPTEGESVPNPLVVRGEARTFESHVALRVLDAEGNVLLQTFTIATASDTGRFGPFESVIYYPVPATPNGTVEVFWNSPKDGAVLDLVRIPVTFESGRRTVKLFWSNQERDPAVSCTKVFATDRQIPKTLTPARASLEELLRGPSEQEANQEHTTSIPRGAQVRSLVVRNGVAYADFNEGLQNVGGSCAVTAIRAQITQTLKQFPNIREVVISVLGNVEEALQP